MKKNLILIFTTLLFSIYNQHAKACSGTPSPGSIISSQSSSCVPFTSTLTLTGASGGAGILYQWASSSDGITFTPIPGATTTTYSATVSVNKYFHCVTTCSTSGLSATTADIELIVYPLTGNTGYPIVCAGFSTNLSNAYPGGVWSSGSPSMASVNPVTGTVTGITAGTATISYTTGPGCSATTVVSVNPLPPAITGVTVVCVASVTTLSNAVTGGTWMSSNALIAAPGSLTGAVTGISAGSTNITYTAPTGCYNTIHVTVNSLPGPISGTDSVCEGATTNLSDGTPGGAWSSSNYSIANPGVVSGVVTGAGPGVATITYTLLGSGCMSTVNVTVHASPAPITGSGHVCLGATATFSDVLTGGIWSSSTTSVAAIGLLTGIISGLTLGTTIISYTFPVSNCSAIKTTTVDPLPNIFGVIGGGSYCIGGTGVHIGLDSSDLGYSYTLYNGASSAVLVTGTGLPFDFGLLTAAGTYTAVATGILSGCHSNMTGSAVVVITPLDSPTVAISTGVGDSVCEGTVTTFTPVPWYGGTTPAYVWTVNGTLVSTSGTYSFIPANGDVVGVTMTSSAACPSPDTAYGSLTISVLPHQLPLVSTSIAPSDTICQHNLVTFTAHPMYGGTAPVYLWYKNAGTMLDTGTAMTYEPVNGDVVRCRMVSNYLCRLADTVNSGNITMNVVPTIVPYLNIISSHHLMLNTGEIDTLTAVVTGAGPNPTYQWMVDTSIIPGATNSTFISTFNNNDSVSCYVTSSGLCNGITTFDWVFITIKNLGVTPANAGLSDIMMLPNPNNGAFTVRGTLGTISDVPVQLEVTDMLGQIVYKKDVTAKAGRINEPIATDGSLANGMYMLNVRSENDHTVFHFVIEK